jgi:hypothetical protein
LFYFSSFDFACFFAPLIIDRGHPTLVLPAAAKIKQISIARKIQFTCTAAAREILVS